MSDIKEVTELVEKQGKAWDEFKKTNDEILAAKADGKAVSDLQATLDKINTDMTAIGKQMTEVEKKAGRPGAGKDEADPAKAEYKKALGAYIRTGDESLMRSQKAMQSNSDPDGGYLIEEEMDAVIERVVPTISSMYRLARNVTISTNKWEKVMKTAGMSMRRVAEGATGGETTEPKFARIEIQVFPAEVEPWVYNETLQDARIDLETDLANEAAIGFAEGSGAEFITGNGVGKARGILGYTAVANASYAWGSVGYVVSGKSAAFTSVAPGDAIVNLQHSLKQQYRPGACFLMNDATLGKARQMKDGSGQYYLWNPDPLVGFGGRFIGSPVEIDNNMPDLGAGSQSIAFGDFSRAYAIVTRAGTSLIRDNLTAKGTTKFNFRRRFGAGVYNFEAFKTLKFATS